MDKLTGFGFMVVYSSGRHRLCGNYSTMCSALDAADIMVSNSRVHEIFMGAFDSHGAFHSQTVTAPDGFVWNAERN